MLVIVPRATKVFRVIQYFTAQSLRSQNNMKANSKEKRKRLKKEISFFKTLCIVAELGITEVYNKWTGSSKAILKRDWRLAPCVLSPTASSCRLHWFSRSSVLKETQGRVEDSNLHRLFIFVSLLRCRSPLFFFFLSKGGKTLPFILKRGTNKAKVWPVNGEFYICFSPLSHLCLHQWSHQTTVELTGWLEIKRERGRRIRLIFQEWHKIPPAVSPSLCVSFLPLHKSIYNHPIYFPLLGHPTFERNLIKWSLMGLWLRLDGLYAPALWYPSTCHCPSSSPTFFSVLFLP